MRRMQMCGLALLVLVAFGAISAASASAAEGPAGLLFLKGVEEVATISGSTGVSTLTEIKNKTSVSCQKTEILESKSEKAKHVTKSKDVDLHLSGCKQGKLKCNTAGDAAEVVLALVDALAVSLLESTKLVPGIALLILNAKLENLPLSITCGVGIVEVKGAGFGKLTLGADVGGGDIEAATLTSPNALACDSSDTLCKELLEKQPFLSNFSGTFGASEMTATAALKVKPMVEVDF